ncbi:MAG: hypothetical protein KBD55_00455 [Candidatus Pacebacteria bacterium]|nr:hypothetical protein [Candidatus Paceibacterota bacterium]
MPIVLITLSLIITTSFLAKNAKKENTKLGYFLVLVSGIIIFLFEPLIQIFLLEISSPSSSLISLFGLYFIVLAIVQLIKLMKNENRSLIKFSNKNILTIIVSVFLFIALFDGLPYGYFTFLRFAVCAVGLYIAYQIYQINKESLWVWFFGSIVVLFNPIIVIHLEREQWWVIDLIVGIFFVISLFLLKANKNN